MKKIKIILASTSPRRKELLRRIIKKFQVCVSQVNESKIKAASPIAFAKKAALLKAKAVACKNKNAIVIGADTIVVLGKKILGKPKDKAQAIKMLKSLSGQTHKVITGLAIVFPTGKVITDSDITRVKMKKIGNRAIIDYVESGRPLDKAGAYGIQEIEKEFVESIEGDFDNVVGLPIYKLKLLLKRKQ